MSARSLLEKLQEELKIGCALFINKNDDLNELDSHLFYIANDFYKSCKRNIDSQKKKTEYLCPGCLSLGKNALIELDNTIFKCKGCENSLKHTIDPKLVSFFRAFFRHNKNGYRCKDCDRFIPHPMDDTPVVSCPYSDCVFVGSWSSLKRMHHPSLQSNPECIVLKLSKNVEYSITSDIETLSKLQSEDLNNKILSLKNSIKSQKDNIPYNSSDFTIVHKMLAYQAFENLMDINPEEMVSYLLDNSRSGGFQHKVFQEYIRLLENSLPILFKKNNKNYKIESLLDDNINLFDGISVFEGVVTDKFLVKNGTKEFYIGGRKAAYTKPFYIGKLLSIVDKNTKISLFDYVKEYSFNKIKMENVATGTEVVVTHLRVPPHYQMGGMVYINRARKKIVDNI